MNYKRIHQNHDQFFKSLMMVFEKNYFLMLALPFLSTDKAVTVTASEAAGLMVGSTKSHIPVVLLAAF